MFVSAGADFFTLAASGVADVVFGREFVFWGLFYSNSRFSSSLPPFFGRLPAPVTGFLFILCSFVTGVTLSAIVFAYTAVSITMVFVITAGMFGAIRLYRS